MGPEAKTFLLENKYLIVRNDFYNLYYELIKEPDKVQSEVFCLFKKLDVNLEYYVHYLTGEEVKIISDNYFYENCPEFFTNNYLPKYWKLKYDDPCKLYLMNGDRVKVLWQKSPYVVIEKNFEFNSYIYLIHYNGIKRI